MRIFQKLLGFSLVFVFASLEAMSHTPKTPQPKKHLESSSCIQRQVCPAKDTCADKYLCPARTDLNCNVDFAISATYLFYLPLQKDLEMVEFIPSSTSTTSYEEKFLNTDFHSGFKFGLGLGIGYDKWEFFAEYAWLHSSDCESYSLSSGMLGMNEYWTSSDYTTNFAKAKWKLIYDMGTFDFGRPSYFGQKLIVKPYVGVKGGVINQRLDAKAMQSNLEEFISKYKSDSWLLGPSFGLKNSYLLSKHFRLFNDLNIHVMYQKFDVKAENLNLSNSSENSSNKWKPHYLTTNINLNLGFGCGCYFNNNNAHFDLALSYDFMYYFNQNMLRRIRVVNYAGDTGDLMIQALNATLRFDF